MRKKFFSNAILGSGIPVATNPTLFQTIDTSDRIYRMTQPGSWWLQITPSTAWGPEILAIELRIVRPSPLPDRILKQYRYIQRRSFRARLHAWANVAVPGAPPGELYARGANVEGPIAIPETQRTTAPFEPYRQANSFGPFWIHSYIQPDQTPRLYHIVGGASFDLPMIAPTSTPDYYPPDSNRIGVSTFGDENEPRQPLHCFFVLAGGEELRIRVRGFNHDVSRQPGFSETIPIDCEPAADEVPAAWTTPIPEMAPTFLALPITL
jgi:hypothetical protein